MPKQYTPNYHVDIETGCWIWAQRVGRDGYGRTWSKGRETYAHILMWEGSNGPVPSGMELDHCCPHGPNRSCVNPAHLEPVLHRVNVRRGKSTKLNADQVKEIRALYPTVHKAELARRYGVTPTQVANIIHFRSWAIMDE